MNYALCCGWPPIVRVPPKSPRQKEGEEAWEKEGWELEWERRQVWRVCAVHLLAVVQPWSRECVTWPEFVCCYGCREEKDESQKSETPTAEIDEEGYSVPPKSTWENDKSSFYSSSDSDSEDERDKRLHIEIKPLSNGAAPLSASVDELRSTVENLTLSPAGMTVRVDKVRTLFSLTSAVILSATNFVTLTTLSPLFSFTLQHRKLLHEADSQMKRSQSVSQQIGSSSPPSRHPYTPLSPPIPPPNPRSSPKLPISGDSTTSRYAGQCTLSFSGPSSRAHVLALIY